jgi:RNA polymerase sigma-70 factor (ECF subfamily)
MGLHRLGYRSTTRIAIPVVRAVETGDGDKAVPVPSSSGGGPDSDEEQGSEAGGGLFPLTRWDLISAVRGSDGDARSRALAELCDLYWYPVYCYARKRGYRAPEAEDFTQELFYRLLKGDRFASMDRGLGSVRSYLLTCVSRLFAEDWRKRRPESLPDTVRIDAALAERRYQNEPHTDESPEKLFDRRWALALLQEVETRLGHEYAGRGKGEAFQALKPFISGKRRGDGDSYAEVARMLGTTEGNVKVQVNRMRDRFRELVRSEVAGTLSTRADVDSELRHLYSALSGGS